MRTIRASEIGTYLFCQRAWWYQRQGVESDNVAQMAAGSQVHAAHSRQVMTSGCLRYVAYGLLLVALVALVVHFTALIV
ncbi:MAG: hypothetical protein DWQ07_24400 [Chloroflexi bacterium]|nr:MAG: hypothetical protein DWQ07_24400 [Chloroflexota bacterium]MBL1196275.1 hypothetical protein [Chloroflexota bacterium]NOH13570.1 hypothetical protein [Chloroflexota bacterium]